MKSKKPLWKKIMMFLDVARDDKAASRYVQRIAKTPGSYVNNASEYFIKIKKVNN